MLTALKNTHYFLIPGPVGNIEAEMTLPEGEVNTIAVICHPHSLQGGSMTNKVVTTLARLFQSDQIATLRFNFRGVGQSAGEFDHGVGEADDLRAVMRWLQEKYGAIEWILAGFSFGSFVAYQVAKEVSPQLLILVAPPVHNFVYSADLKPTFPSILVQADDDDVVPAAEVYHWMATLPSQPTLIQFPEGGHFFHGKLIELRDRLLPLIRSLLE